MRAHGDAKRGLEKKVLELKRSIATWTHGLGAISGFDWPVEFAEVFQDGGFDVVVANPPYVRQELIKGLKPALEAVFPEVFTGVADLFVYFYARALQILRPGGMLSFISPNKWFRAAYGAQLRRHITETCHIVSITDFGELPVFRAAATFPMIFVCRKGRAMACDSTIFTQVKSLQSPYPDVLALIRQAGGVLPAGALTGSTWILAKSASIELFDRMRGNSEALGAIVAGRILYGIKTGFNQAFFLDNETRLRLIGADFRSSEIIWPLAVGDDVRKWHVVERHRYLIVTRIGVDIKRYPAVLEHLSTWKEELKKRCDKGDNWWELRPCDYYDEFAKPRILFPDIAKESRFAYGKPGLYSVNTTYFICSDSLFLLAVLNSSLAWEYCKQHMTVIGDPEQGGRLRFFRQFVKAIPIPRASLEAKRSIASLAKKCIESTGSDLRRLEDEIENRVAELYGVDPSAFKCLRTP